MAKRKRTPARDPKTGRFLTKRQRAARKASRKRKRRRNRPARKKTTRRRTARRSTRKRRRNPVARRTPPRDSKGRFKRRGGGTAPRRRRRNPPARRGAADLFGRVQDGLVEGSAVLLGEGATRIAPSLLRLPQTGPTGIAIQTAAALVVGMGTETLGFGGPFARAATAGAFSVPLKTLVLTYVAPQFPMISAAYVPTMAAYPRRLGRYSRMGAYARPTLPAASGNGVGYPYGSGYQSHAAARTMGAYDYAAGIM